MSTITVNYTPGITSSAASSSPFICHRICYNIQGGGAPCCIEDLTDSVAGTPKSIDIIIADAPCSPGVPDVDAESCTNTIYTGYVQACCESESSLSGRVPFTATFVADPSCVNKQVCCTSQRTLIDAYMNIADVGSGYDDALSPLSVIVVRNLSDPVPAGGGNDADVQVTLSGGMVTVVTVNSGGLYGISPLIIVPSPTLGSPGITASIVVVVPCADNRFQGDCITSPQEVNDTELLLGQCANICFPKDFPFIYAANDLSGLPDLTNFRYSSGGCCDCSTCRNYTVVTNSDLATIDVCYTFCTSGGSDSNLRCGSHAGAGSFNISCVVPGSVYSTNDPNGIVSVIDNGACGSCP